LIDRQAASTSLRLTPHGRAILPALMGADPLNLESAALACINAGADGLHIDVMDGRFASSITFGEAVIRRLRELTGIPLDVHLQVDDPEAIIPAVARAGADIVTVHVEATRHVNRVLRQIRDLGARAGVAVNPGTPLALVQEVLGCVDVLCIMTVDPGSKSFSEAMISKIARARQMLHDTGKSTVNVEADGGVNLERAPRMIEAGADWLVAASAIFSAGCGIGAAITDLKRAVQ
jgi:ribulose-phosphate 3-epimerase